VNVPINLVRAWGLRKSMPNESYTYIVRYDPASSTYRFHRGLISTMSATFPLKNVLASWIVSGRIRCVGSRHAQRRRFYSPILLTNRRQKGMIVPGMRDFSLVQHLLAEILMLALLGLGFAVWIAFRP